MKYLNCDNIVKMMFLSVYIW